MAAQVFIAPARASGDQPACRRELVVAVQVVLALLGKVVVAFVEAVLLVLGRAHGQAQAAIAQAAFALVHDLRALGEDDFRKAPASAVVGQEVARVRRVPAIGPLRAARAPAEVEGVAAHVVFDGLVVAAQRAAAALFVHQVEAAAHLEAAHVIQEPAHAAHAAVVAGVFGNAVAVAIDRVVAVVVHGGRHGAALQGLGQKHVQPPGAEVAALHAHLRLIARGALGDDVHRASQRFGRNQAGARAARNVDALHAIQAHAVQPVGGRHGGIHRNAVNQQRGVAPGQVVEQYVAHVADGAFHLHGHAGVLVHGLVHVGRAGFFDGAGAHALGHHDVIAQRAGAHLALGARAQAVHRHFGQRAAFFGGRGLDAGHALRLMVMSVMRLCAHGP